MIFSNSRQKQSSRQDFAAAKHLSRHHKWTVGLRNNKTPSQQEHTRQSIEATIHHYEEHNWWRTLVMALHIAKSSPSPGTSSLTVDPPLEAAQRSNTTCTRGCFHHTVVWRVAKHRRKSECSEDNGHCCCVHCKEGRKGGLVTSASVVTLVTSSSQTSHNN